MYPIFYNLDKEKQNRIINAGLRTFSKTDYKHASTDDIAADAEIAKGSLFHYFKNKHSFFVFLYEYSIKFLGTKADEGFNFNETDYFEILHQSQKIKMDLLGKYPYLYTFVIKASHEKMPELIESIKGINQKIEMKMYDQIFGKIDLSKFKDGTDVENLTKMITWCSEGIWNDGIKNRLSMSDMYKQTLQMYDFFKQAVYKEEHQ